jgi:hypothetical protein
MFVDEFKIKVFNNNNYNNTFNPFRIPKILCLTSSYFFTLIQVQRENGKVAIIRRMETRASRRAQIPGPSGSAEIR